jgi:hypothetical protein
MMPSRGFFRQSCRNRPPFPLPAEALESGAPACTANTSLPGLTLRYLGVVKNRQGFTKGQRRFSTLRLPRTGNRRALCTPAAAMTI